MNNLKHSLKSKWLIKSDDSSGSEDSGKSYEVEKILEKTTKKGKTHYLIKWKGYAENYNSWEPSSALNCYQLVEEFKKSRKRQLKKPSKPIFPQKEERVLRRKKSVKIVKLINLNFKPLRKKKHNATLLKKIKEILNQN